VTTYLRQRSKAIVSLATALVTAAQTVIGPNHPVLNVLLPLIGAFGVWWVPNEPVPEDGKHSLGYAEWSSPTEGSHHDGQA
jgi:hypothetical protein